MANAKEADYYEVLGISRSANETEVRRISHQMNAQRTIGIGRYHDKTREVV